jgi:hypothetical protein
MAVTIRGDTPAVTADTTNPISVTLSGDRQPQAGDLLWIVHFNNFYAFANMPTPTVGGSTDGVAAVDGGSQDNGSGQAHVKTYTYKVESAGNLTVAVSETGSADEDKGLAVYVLSGVDLDDPVDAAAGSGSTNSQDSHVVTGVTTSSDGSLLIIHLCTGAGASTASYTVPESMVEAYNAKTAFMNYVGATEQLGAAGDTGTRTFTPASSVNFAAVAVAIRAAADATVAAALDGTLPALEGSAAAAASAAVTVAGSLPTLQGTLGGAVSSAAAVAGSLPAPQGDVAATASATVALAGTLPTLAGQAIGAGSAATTLAGTLPQAAGGLVGAASAAAGLAGTLPPLAGELAGAASAAAELAGTLPALTGSLAAASPEDTTLAATLPALIGEATATASASAVLSTSLPALTGAVAGTASTAATLAGTLPQLVGLFGETPPTPAVARGQVVIGSTTARLTTGSTTERVRVL